MPAIVSKRFITGILWMMCTLASSSCLAQLTPAQVRGKQIYSTGTSLQKQQIEAVLGDGSTRVPARLMPCGSCHGMDGLGRPEGGVVPSGITWDTLVRPLRSDKALARTRPAYTLPSLRRAIREAVDPAAHRLNSTMPVYHMSAADMNDLLAYLKILGREPEPGITARAIRIGVAAPQGSNQNLAALVQAYFDELNQQGGIYGRRVEPQMLPSSSMARPDNIFAAISVLSPGARNPLVPVMEQAGIPTVGTFATGEQQSKTFYVLSGLGEQAQVLVKFARRDSDMALGIVYPETMRPLADKLMAQSAAWAFASVLPLKYSSSGPNEIVGSLLREKIDRVLFLGSGTDLQQLFAVAAKTGWSPTVYQPGTLAGTQVFNAPAQLADRIFLAFPTLPSDLSSEAVQELRDLAGKHKVNVAQPALALATLASAKVLAEGLRQAGRQLTRETFVHALAGLYDFNTGATPQITFGPDRRIGALGAYVVKLDLANKTFSQVDSWITP